MASNSPPPNSNPYQSPTSSDASTGATPSAATIRYELPRWWHLAILMACWAIEFARLYLPLLRIGLDSYLEMLSPLAMAFDLVRTLLAAVAMSAVVLVIVEWLRCRPFPRQPGEWILVAWGAVQWFAVVFMFANEMIPAFEPTRTTISVVPVLVQAAILALGGIIAGSGRAWAVSLSNWAVAVVLSMMLFLRVIARDSGLPSWLQSATAVGLVAATLIGAIAFIVAVVSDVRRKERRGWIHAVALAWIGANIVFGIMLQLASR